MNIGRNAQNINKIEEDRSKTVSQEARGIVTRFKDGDAEAFKMIYMQWYDPIYYLLRRITRSEVTAEDLAQDVFSTLWLQRESVDPAQEIKGYIFTLARRSAFKHIRRTRVENDYLSSSEFHSEDSTDSHSDIETKELKLLTDCYISNLPRQRRDAYLLSVHDGLDPAEIAEQLGITPKSARDHIYQARKGLKDLLAYYLMVFYCSAPVLQDIDKFLPK